MKWLCITLTLALGLSAQARGLKAPRAPEANAVRSKQLELENESLRKTNDHLEAMMQMARTEVHRMDAAATEDRSRNRHHENCGDVEVMKQEIEDLKKKQLATEGDKTDLVQTLRRMLAKNSTQIFQNQAVRAQQANTALELKCGRQRQAFEQQLDEANEKIKEANGKCDETKEVAQSLHDENVQDDQKLQKIRSALAKALQANKELEADKVNLVTTMQNLMRENSRFKHGLKQETAIEEKEAQELSIEKATLAKLSGKGKAPKTAAKKQTKAALKLMAHHEHSAAQKAHMRSIDRYMYTAEGSDADNDDIGGGVSSAQMTAVQNQAELLEKGKVGTHLSDWLGFPQQPKPAAPEAPAVTKKKKAQKKQDLLETYRHMKAAPKDPESEAEALLNEAKAQLADMESAEA